MELECEWTPFQLRVGTGKAEPPREKSVCSHLHPRGRELAGPKSPSCLVGETNPYLVAENQNFQN